MERVRAAMGLPPTAYRIEDDLKELSFGQWEGLTWREVEAIALERVRERKRDKWAFVPPEGESYRDLGERLRPWLAGVAHQAVVVAHGGVARVLSHLIAGASAAEAPDLDIWQGRVMRFHQNRSFWHG